MRHPLSRFCLFTTLALTACHSAPPTVPANPSPVQSQSIPQPASRPSTPETKPVPAPTRPHVMKNNPQIAQLDLGSEGGTRDGSYAMWVHVSEDGKPVPNLPVRAYKSEDRVAASARTNSDGDARLLVQVADYRIAATHGKRHATQTVTYRPGSQFELQLTR